MNKKELISQLYNLRKLINQDECEAFENKLAELSEVILIEHIGDVCKIFDDNTKNDEIMFDVIHMIEKLAGYDYLKCIATHTPLMIEGKDWALTLNKRILNSKKYYPEYIEVIKSLNKNEKKQILDLLITVKNDNISRFGEKVDYLLQRCRYTF